MLALRKLTADTPGLTLCDIAPPAACADDEVLVRVHATGICGSDLHLAVWPGWPPERLPLTIGHEFSGVVLAAGAQAGLAVGTRVVARSEVHCGQCAACQRGDPEACTALGFIGVTHEGAFTETIKVRAAHCHALPADVDLATASLAEPLAVARCALRTADVQPGQTVLVLGPGSIGQAIALQALDLGAAQVVIAGLDDAPRLAQCQALGLHHTLDLAEDTLAAALPRLIGSASVDHVFEATGHPSSISDGLTVLGVGGVLTVCGVHFQHASIDTRLILKNRLQIRGSLGSTERDWLAVMAFMQRKGEALAPMITHRLPLREAEQGFALARSKAASKVLLMPDA